MTLSRFRFTRRVIIAIILVGIVSSAVLVYVYYSMSVASVNGLTVDEVLAVRNYVSGTSPKRNATFIFEFQVWSKSQSLSVRLDKPLFHVELPGVTLGNETFPSGTIVPGSYLTYNLRFNINESVNIGPISFPNSTVVVQVTTYATSGLYSRTITVGDIALWDWTTSTCRAYCLPGD